MSLYELIKSNQDMLQDGAEQLHDIKFTGADYDYCNKINGKFIITGESKNGFPVYQKENNDNICLWLRDNGGYNHWVIGNRDWAFAYIESSNNIWMEMTYEDNEVCFRENTNLCGTDWSMTRIIREQIINNQINIFERNMDIDRIQIDGADTGESVVDREDSITDVNRCVICLDGAAEIGILHGDTMHNCMCRTCSIAYQDTGCPVCRVAIERRIRVY
uniref:RING-type domain-containing protein n=1 Tax=Mimiviridae sp. ChoanoV1 TaxID=2596887 RepID=A0A5B8IHW8_9VIRU|nr:hypothetical protein 1_277 [Mimiviridae sp. ChoanoV1]